MRDETNKKSFPGMAGFSEMREVLPTIEQLESELADDGPARTGKKRGGKPK